MTPIPEVVAEKSSWGRWMLSWKFERTISISHIVSFALFLATGIYSVAAFNNRLTNLEVSSVDMRIAIQETSKQIMKLTESTYDLRVSIAILNGAIDTGNRRPGVGTD